MNALSLEWLKPPVTGETVGLFKEWRLQNNTPTSFRDLGGGIQELRKTPISPRQPPQDHGVGGSDAYAVGVSRGDLPR